MKAFKGKATKNIKYNGKRYAKGADVIVNEADVEAVESSGAVVDLQEVNVTETKLPKYDKITEDDIRAQLDELGVNHAEAKDKKAAYALLEAAVNDNK